MRENQCCPDLPNNIWLNILSRLQVKDLVRSMSVSSLWNAMIRDPRLVELHKSRAVPTFVINAIYNPKKFTPRTSLLLMERNYKVLSSTSGFFCVQIRKCCYGIYNPATKKFLQLPTTPLGPLLSLKLYIGVGTGENKVVGICMTRKCWWILTIGREGPSSWRKVKIPSIWDRWRRDSMIFETPCVLYDHGAHHYRGTCKHWTQIFSLDIENEQVISHSLPFEKQHPLVTPYQITDTDGHLSIIFHGSGSNGGQDMITWVLEDYKANKWRNDYLASPISWEEFSVRPSNVNISILSICNGKMWCANSSNNFFWFDPKSDMKENYQLGVRLIHGIFRHISTLESLEGMQTDRVEGVMLQHCKSKTFTCRLDNYVLQRKSKVSV